VPSITAVLFDDCFRVSVDTWAGLLAPTASTCGATTAASWT